LEKFGEQSSQKLRFCKCNFTSWI